MRDLSGKVIVITGAASGIGRALAVGLASEGAHLALCDVDGAALRETARLAASSPRVTTRVVDVADREAVEAFARAVQDDHGVVDILVNNAGTSCVTRVENATYEDFEYIFGVNLWGAIHGVKAFLPLLKQRPRAQIVNVASINAYVPFPSNGPYNISKFGVDALSRTLLMEYAGTGIKVSCVYPGGVKTNIARNSRYVSEEDAAGFADRAMTTPERAARRIIAGIKRERSRILVGADARALALLSRLAPMITLRLITWSARKFQRTR